MVPMLPKLVRTNVPYGSCGSYAIDFAASRGTVTEDSRMDIRWLAPKNHGQFVGAIIYFT